MPTEAIDAEQGSARWADSHCHVYDERIPDGTDPALEVSARHRDVWATVGLHPHEASHGTDTIRDLLDHPRVVAVGEAGLDHHYDHSPRQQQAEAFRVQIGWANECWR